MDASTERAATSERLSVVEKIGYGMGDLASNIVFQMVIVFMPLFYTDVFGIGAAAMGTLFLVVRVFDAVTDPAMGALCDRTETRWGKFRPYLLWLSVPFAAAAVMSFTTPSLSEDGKLAYAYVTYFLLMAAYTAINIPYCALGGVMTDDSRERVSLNGYRFAMASVATILVTSSTLPMVKLLGQGNDQRGFTLTIGVLGVLAVGFFVACFALTEERVKPRKASDESSFWRDLGVLMRNDQWWVVAVANFLLLIPLIMRGGSAAYYVKWYAETGWFDDGETMLTAMLTTGAVAMILGAPFATVITKWLTNARAYSAVHAAIGLVSVGMYFLPPGATIAIFVAYGLTSFFTQMGNPILWAMLADTVDYGERQSGRRITGLSFAGALFALKVGMALGGALLGWTLAHYDYDGQATRQSDRAVQGVVLTFTVLPAIGHFLLAAAVLRYRSDPANGDS